MAWSDSLAVVLLGAWLHGFGLEIFSVGWDLSIQEQVDPDKLARVYSFDMIGSFIARPVGLVLTGPMAALVGGRAWLTVVGAVILGSVLVALTSGDVRRLRAPAAGRRRAAGSRRRRSRLTELTRSCPLAGPTRRSWPRRPRPGCRGRAR